MIRTYVQEFPMHPLEAEGTKTLAGGGTRSVRYEKKDGDGVRKIVTWDFTEAVW